MPTYTHKKTNLLQRSYVMPLVMVLTVYMLLLGYLYLNQRNMMYFPVVVNGHAPADYGLEMQVIQTRTSDDLVLRHWFHPPAGDDYPVIVYFHGNGGHLGHYAGQMRIMMQHGYGVMAVGYRGYGDNPGRPSETGLYADAHSVMKWLLNRGYTRDDLYLLGISLGGGVATEMAQTYDIAGLILLAPFSSALDVAKSHYWYFPVSFLMKDHFDNISKITEIDTALFILHGESDRIVSLSFAEKLYHAAHEPKEISVTEQGGHNDLFTQDGFGRIHYFIQSHL